MLLLLVLFLALVVGVANTTWARLLLSLLLFVLLTFGFWMALLAPKDAYSFGRALGAYLVPAVIFLVLSVLAHLLRRLLFRRRRRAVVVDAGKTFD